VVEFITVVHLKGGYTCKVGSSRSYLFQDFTFYIGVMVFSLIHTICTLNVACEHLQFLGCTAAQGLLPFLLAYSTFFVEMKHPQICNLPNIYSLTLVQVISGHDNFILYVGNGT
jgi:hypothetical protein